MAVFDVIEERGLLINLQRFVMIVVVYHSVLTQGDKPVLCEVVLYLLITLAVLCTFVDPYLKHL